LPSLSNLHFVPSNQRGYFLKLCRVKAVVVLAKFNLRLDPKRGFTSTVTFLLHGHMQPPLLDTVIAKQNAKGGIQRHLPVKSLLVIGALLTRVPRHTEYFQHWVIRKVLLQNG
jgi:hypothetical protein